MPKGYSCQNLTLHTVYNVIDAKTLNFLLFQFFAVSWFKKNQKPTTQPSVAIIAMNYTTTDGRKFIRLQSQDFSD